MKFKSSIGDVSLTLEIPDMPIEARDTVLVKNMEGLVSEFAMLIYGISGNYAIQLALIHMLQNKIREVGERADEFLRRLSDGADPVEIASEYFKEWLGFEERLNPYSSFLDQLFSDSED